MKVEPRASTTPSGIGLEVEEDAGFAHREWRIQKFGWCLLGLVIAAAALGIFGSGTLSKATLTSDGLSVTYERFERVQRPAKVTLSFGSMPGETAQVLIGRGYMDAIRLQRITPEPESVYAGPHGWIHHFRSSGDRTTVIIHFQPEEVGVIQGQIGLQNGPMLILKQYVYP